jgi:hypothetical protein
MGDPQSPLLAHLGNNLTIMPSRELLESILKHKTMDLSALLATKRPAANRAATA